MLDVRLICVGRLKESYWREAAAEYEKRLRPLCKFQMVEVAETRLPDDPSPAQIAQALDQEGGRLLGKAAGKIVPLCVEGLAVDSPGLAALLEGAMRSPGAVSFLIGSSYGLSPAAKAAGRGISLSPLTFPHQLARVLLCEQIYRGFQILNGARYHK